MNCFCGKPMSYEKCCKPFHLGLSTPATAQDLMRSRYSAFATHNYDYLIRTLDPDSQKVQSMIQSHESNKKWGDSVEFTKLEILDSKEDGDNAWVDFKAYYVVKSSREPSVHHELSQFRRIKNLWFYLPTA